MAMSSNLNIDCQPFSMPLPNLVSVPQSSGPYGHVAHNNQFWPPTPNNTMDHSNPYSQQPPAHSHSHHQHHQQHQPQPSHAPNAYCPIPQQPFTFSNVLIGNQPLKANAIQLTLPSLGSNGMFSPRSNRSSSPETPTESLANNTNPNSPSSQSPMNSSYAQIQLQPQRQKLSIVLFDWDDTLYPTTCIINKKENVTASELNTFGKLLYDMFAEYIKVYGGSNIYIITNSSKNWTLKSLKICSKIYQKKMRIRQERAVRHGKHTKKDGVVMTPNVDYFAAVHDSLVSLSIRIISAQYLYAQQYPHKPSIWKIKAFKQITIEHFKNIKGVSSGDNIIYEIVSIGDSENEYVASFEAKYKLNKFIKRRKSRNNIIRLHRIKLTKEPKINVMIKQLRLLIDEAILMHCEPGSVTIRYQ